MLPCKLITILLTKFPFIFFIHLFSSLATTSMICFYESVYFFLASASVKSYGIFLSLTSLSIIHSSSIHVVPNGKISFFLWERLFTFCYWVDIQNIRNSYNSLVDISFKNIFSHSVNHLFVCYGFIPCAEMF